MNQPIYSTTAPELNPTNTNDLKKEIHNAAIDRAIEVVEIECRAECGYCHGEGIKHDPVCKGGKDIIIVLLKEKI